MTIFFRSKNNQWMNLKNNENILLLSFWHGLLRKSGVENLVVITIYWKRWNMSFFFVFLQFTLNWTKSYLLIFPQSVVHSPVQNATNFENIVQRRNGHTIWFWVWSSLQPWCPKTDPIGVKSWKVLGAYQRLKFILLSNRKAFQNISLRKPNGLYRFMFFFNNDKINEFYVQLGDKNFWSLTKNMQKEAQSEQSGRIWCHRMHNNA